MSELGSRAPTYVAFQQAAVSAVDDVILETDAETGSRAVRLAIACRRSPQFTRSNSKTKELFVSLVRADIAADNSEVEDRIAIAVSGHQNGAREIAELASLARNQSNATAYFSLVKNSGQHSAELRSRLSHFVDLVKSALVSINVDAASIDHRCWSLLKRLYVLSPGLEPSNDGDWVALADLLKPWSVDSTAASAIALRNELETLAGEFAQTAAAVDANTLRRRLHPFIDSTKHRFSVGWKRLLLLNREARVSVPRTLTGSGIHGDLTLERTEMRTELAAALQRMGEDLLVRGESGVGKSAAVLAAVEPSMLGENCQAVALNLRDLPDTPLDFVAALCEPLEDLLAGLTAPQRLLIVDGAEAAAESKREVFAHIIRSARNSEAKVVAVAASEGASVVAELMKAGGAQVREYAVPSLSDDEISVAVRHFPELERLAEDPKGRELLRRPIVIELLARAGNPGVPLSDSDALAHVWKQLVRNGERRDAGLPDAREQAMLSLAAHALTKGPIDSLLASLDPAAIAGLRHSALIRSRGSLPWERVPEFAHDLLRAYAVARQLVATRSPASELGRVSSPRWALPAARLACELLLSSADTAEDPLLGRFSRLQATFEDLAESGHGERWADAPTEAMLAIAHPLPILEDAWSGLLQNKAAGVRRLIRVLKLRYQREGILDTIVAEPVIMQLLHHGVPQGLGKEAANLTLDWLIDHVLRRTASGQPTRLALARMIVDRCTEKERELDRQEAADLAARAARSPEEIAAEEERRRKFAGLSSSFTTSLRRRVSQLPQRRPYEWIHESSVAHLALLGPDLGLHGEAILRRIAKDEPHFLAPAVETELAGQALADFDPVLLVDLVEAYYLEADEQDEDGFEYSGFREDGVRDHTPSGLGIPLASYYRGPFLAMFRADYRRGIACLNRLLNHAARHRAQILSNLGPPPAPDNYDGQYEHVMSITGEPRNYIGDVHVWLWYRGTGVGPYPCMSALQALEFVSEEAIRLGVPITRLVPVLLEGAESLAMPGLVLGMLVRHLETANEALDPFIVEPLVWDLEFSRLVQESSGLAAQVPGLTQLDRRKWSLREVCIMLTLQAQGERVEQLRRLGERLITAARAQVGDDMSSDTREHLAAVKGWAATLDRTSYQVEERDGQLLFYVANPEVETVLEESNTDLRRGNEAIGLTVRHAQIRDRGGRAPDMSSEALAADLAIAQGLIADPPKTAMGASPDGPVAAAASAIELHFGRGVNVTDADLRWSAEVVLDVASTIMEHPSDVFEFSLFSQGTDRSAGRVLPYLLLPSALELRRSLEIDSADGVELLIALSRAVAWGASHEARLAYARGLDAVWSAPCSAGLQSRCHHRVAWDLVEVSCQDCALGPWNNDLRQRTIVHLQPPILSSLAAIDADCIIVRRLSAALRACGSAAISGACCQQDAQEALDILLAAHRRGMLAHKNGYHHSDSDSLIAARAALWQATDYRDRPLLDHVQGYLNDSRMVAEALKAINAAAEECADAATAAQRLWPNLMDLVLGTREDNPADFADRYWGDSLLAALVPNPAYTWGYLTLELVGESERWRDLLAWSPQINRWLSFAVGSRESIDALVIALQELKVSDQVDTGLKWLERLVQGGDCPRTFTLPKWLRDRRADLTTPEQEARWQRIVDVLVVSGDTRVADLAD